MSMVYNSPFRCYSIIIYYRTYYGQVKQLLKKLTNVHEKAPSISNVFASAADTGFGFDLSLGSVLSPHAAPHPASPAPYLAPISPQLGEAALPGNCEYPGGGDNQRPNAGFFAESCGQKAGASSGSGGVGPTDATPRLVKPLPGILSNRAVSFAAAFKSSLDAYPPLVAYPPHTPAAHPIPA